MILTLIGLSLNFIGTFILIIETISGGSIRPKIYQSVIRGVYEYHGDDDIRKIKLMPHEIRVLLWISLIFLGFLLQIWDFFV